ncbi:MAG: thioredoxin domain-containing protein [Pyrinomonadaceae bacterium]
MRPLFVFVFLTFLSLAAFAQKPDDVLGTAAGRSIKLVDLSPETQQAVSSLPTRVFATRTAILDQMVSQRLLDAEAKVTGISAGKLFAAEKAKVANPTDAQIKEVYDANQQALAESTPEQARKQIIAYLRREPEQKLLGALLTRLKAKYKYTAGKPVNSTPLAPADVVATVNGVPITAKEYEEFAAVALYELSADVGDLIMQDVNEALYNAMIGEEAKSLKIEPSALLAREITNKMKDFSNEERTGLEIAFSKSLAAKYKPVILYKYPEPVVQKISVDDDPAMGPANAPVTVVMFSDFQCPACSAAHTVLKQAIEAFPGKVRFVVRDFPLESIHANAFNAARAASAANAQGKFFEYGEFLYKHQDALDTPSLLKYATEMGLNVKQFELDFNSEKTAAEIRKDQADGDSYIVNSTPTIFVNGVRVRDLSFDSFKAAIERALGAK